MGGFSEISYCDVSQMEWTLISDLKGERREGGIDEDVKTTFNEKVNKLDDAKSANLPSKTSEKTDRM